MLGNKNKKGMPPIVYIGGVLLLGFAGTQGYQAFQDSKTGSDQIKIYGNTNNQLVLLGDSFSGYSTLRSTTFANRITKEDFGIRYQNELDQAQRAKKLGKDADLIVTTLDQFLTHRPDGKIVGLIDKTVGADAVILNTVKFPNLKSLNDIQKIKASNPGLKIVYSAGTPSEYLAHLLDVKFDKLSLSTFDVAKVEDSSQAYQKLKSDPSVAIAVLWEPDVSRAQQDGNTVVLSSKDVPDSIIDVIVASNKLISEKPEQLKSFLTSYYRHTDSLIGNANTLSTQIASDSGLSTQDAGKVASGIDFFSSIKTAKWFSDGMLKKRIQATNAILTLSGQSTGSISDVSALYNASFIKEAVAITRQAMETIKATDPGLATALSGEKTTAALSMTRQQLQSAKSIGNLNVKGVVSFGTGSATLTNEGRLTLDKLAEELADFSQSTTALNIVGHTSKVGPAALNQTLSEQRAQVVASYLKSRGLKLAIASQGMGFSQTLSGIDPDSAKNQRTEVQLKRIGG
jgi:OmpA-OmpF porin, OOP family